MATSVSCSSWNLHLDADWVEWGGSDVIGGGGWSGVINQIPGVCWSSLTNHC